MIMVEIRSEDDIAFALSSTRYLMNQSPFSESQKQSVYVCVLELTRNVLDHGGGRGLFRAELVSVNIRITVTDQGRGIPNVQEVLNGSHRSRTCLGLGLSGAKRLMDQFDMDTSPKGTRIVATKRGTQHAI